MACKRSGPLSVLIIDGQRDRASATAAVLQRLSPEAIRCVLASGREQFAQQLETNPAVILLDLLAPPGLQEVMSELQQRRLSTPVIVVADTADAARTLGWIEAGAEDCILREHLEIRLGQSVMLAARRMALREVQNRAEQAGRMQAARFEALLGSLDEIAFEFDTRGTYLNIWTTNESLLYQPREQVLGKTVQQILPLPIAEQLQSALERVARSGKAETIEYPLDVIDGRRWFLARISSLAIEGGDEATLCMLARDITERRQAEEVLRQSDESHRRLLQASPEAIFIHRDMKFVYLNDAAVRLLGAPSSELMYGRSILEIVPPELHDFVRSRINQVYNGLSIPLHEQRIVRLDGVQLDVEVVGILCTYDGLPAVQALVHDISVRKQTAEHFRQHQAELAHALRLATMGEIAAGLAHELSQPLSAAMNYTRGCIRRIKSGMAQDAELIEALEQAASQAEHAGKIVHGLWNLVRKRQPQRTQVQLNDLVHEALRFLESPIRRGRVRVQLQLESELPPTEADPVQIEQVILNLLMNALDAMADLQGRARELTITTRRQDQKLIELAVSDTGVGMPPRVLASVFDPFFTTKPSGLGMGLSICRSIVQDHNGRLTIESEVDCGTTIRFNLPIAADWADEGESIGRAPTSAGHAG